MATTAAEAVGQMKGSAEIVKLQQTTQAIQQFETTTQLQQLSYTVHGYSQVIETTQTKPTPQQALCLLNLILPEFTGGEDLNRFLDQVSTLLEALGVRPQNCSTFVKQQCHCYLRAYDALLDAKKKHTFACVGSDPSKASPDDFIKFTKHTWVRSKKNAGNRRIRKSESCCLPITQCSKERTNLYQTLHTGFQKFSINWRSISPMYIKPQMVQRLN